MSTKQRRYVQARAQGMTCRDAAEHAGYTAGPSQSARELEQAYRRMEQTSDITARWLSLQSKIRALGDKLEQARKDLAALEIVAEERRKG